MNQTSTALGNIGIDARCAPPRANAILVTEAYFELLHLDDNLCSGLHLSSLQWDSSVLLARVLELSFCVPKIRTGSS
jgi:hypothetical protein